MKYSHVAVLTYYYMFSCDQHVKLSQNVDKNVRYMAIN